MVDRGNTPEPYFSKLYLGILHHLPEMKTDGRALVYMALHARRNVVTGQLNPTIETLAKDAGVYDDTCTRAMKWLVDRGLVEKISRRFAPNQYALPEIDQAGNILPYRSSTGTAELRDGDSSDRQNTAHRPGEKAGQKESKRKESKRAAARCGSAADRSAVQAGDVTTTLSAEELDWEPYSGNPCPWAADDVEPEAEGQTQLSPPAVQASTGEPKPEARKGNRLTEADREAARSGSTPLAGFLGYGAAGAHTPPDQWMNLKPYDRCWFAHLLTREGEQSLDDLLPTATELQVAAYAFWKMNTLLEDRGQPLILPDGSLIAVGRSKGMLGNLFATRGAEWCIRHVQTVTDHFREITDRLRNYSNPMTITIDEGLFRHREVVSQSNAITQTQEAK